MASAYDVFKPEFDKLSEQEKMDLSMAGLIAYRENGRGGTRRTRPSSSTTGMLGRSYDDNMGGFDLSGESLDTRITDFDDQSAFTLVDRMRRETYRVVITNALADIVSPIGYILEDNRLRQQLFETRMENEHFLYYRSMISAIDGLGESNKSNFIEGLILQYRNFMRHPVWNSLRILSERVLRPMFNVARGLLFGFKKRESDTDRIVNAIHDQTEFLRKGESGGRGGFFSRLMREGLVGMPLKALGEAYLSSFTSISRERAQAVEDARASGEQRDKSILDRLSMSIFGGSIDRKGNPAELKRNTLLDDILKANKNSSMYLSNIKLINQSMLFEIQQIKNSLGDDDETNLEMSRTGTDNIASNISSINNSNKSFVSQQKEMNEQLAVANEVFGEIDNNTKESSKILDKIRGTQMFQLLSSWARTGLNITTRAITSIGGAVAGGLTGIGATIATALITKLGLVGTASGGLAVSLVAIGGWGAYKLTEWLNKRLGTSDEDIQAERNARLRGFSLLNDLYNPMSRPRLSERIREEAKQQPEYVQRQQQINALNRERDALIRNPQYQVDAEMKQRALVLDSQIRNLAKEQDDFQRDYIIRTKAQSRRREDGRGDVSSLGLLDFIGKYESKGNYNALTYGRKGYSVPSEANLTDMTIGEVYEYQKGMVDRGHASDAVGKYQFTRQTLSEMVARVPDITEDTKFTKAVQDRLAHELLVVEGYNRWVSGEMPTTEFINEVAGRWAAIPNMSGKSAYDGLAGNKHGVGLMPTIEVFESFKSKFNTNEGILRRSVVVPTVQQPQQPVVTAKPQQNAIPMLSAPAIESAKTVGSMNTEESVTWLKGIKGSIDQLSTKFGEMAESIGDMFSGSNGDPRIAGGLTGDD